MDFDKVLQKYRQLCQSSSFGETNESIPVSSLSITEPSSLIMKSNKNSTDWRTPPNVMSNDTPDLTTTKHKTTNGSPVPIESVQSMETLEPSISFLGPPETLDSLEKTSCVLQGENSLGNDFIKLFQRGSDLSVPSVSPISNISNISNTSKKENGKDTSTHPIFGNSTESSSVVKQEVGRELKNQYESFLSHSLPNQKESTYHSPSEETISRDPRRSSTYMSRQEMESNIRFSLEQHTKTQMELDQVRLEQQVILRQLQFLKQLLGIDDDEIDYTGVEQKSMSSPVIIISEEDKNTIVAEEKEQDEAV